MADILIVDDSTDILEVMKDILESEGHMVRTATGKKGMMYEVKKSLPDLIILDILLSGDNGRDICKAIKADPVMQDIPVLLMSASPRLLSDPEECGAFDTISKPFHLSDLTEKVRNSLKILPLILLSLKEVTGNIFRNL